MHITQCILWSYLAIYHRINSRVELNSFFDSLDVIVNKLICSLLVSFGPEQCIVVLALREVIDVFYSFCSERDNTTQRKLVASCAL